MRNEEQTITPYYSPLFQICLLLMFMAISLPSSANQKSININAEYSCLSYLNQLVAESNNFKPSSDNKRFLIKDAQTWNERYFVITADEQFTISLPGRDIPNNTAFRIEGYPDFIIYKDPKQRFTHILPKDQWPKGLNISTLPELKSKKVTQTERQRMNDSLFATNRAEILNLIENLNSKSNKEILKEIQKENFDSSMYSQKKLRKLHKLLNFYSTSPEEFCDFKENPNLIGMFKRDKQKMLLAKQKLSSYLTTPAQSSSESGVEID